jgi:hypothetical protein
MPRKSRKQQIEQPNADPAPIADAAASMPAAASLPDTDGSEAALRFKQQREREQAVTEPASPPFEPQARVKSWGETVRPWKGFGPTIGVHHVTTVSPDMVGIQFDPGKHRTDEEKREMESANLKFFTEAQAWLKPNRDGAYDQTQALAERFAERRREDLAREWQR